MSPAPEHRAVSARAILAAAVAATFLGACVQYEPSIATDGEPCRKLRSGYAGDELCMQAPDPAEGFQLHYGPSNYDDSEDVDRFVLQPGDETLHCMAFNAPDQGEFYTKAIHIHMRGGTHHMLLYTSSSPDAEVREGRLTNCDRDASWGYIAGSQAALTLDGGILDLPDPDKTAPGDADIVARYAPGTKFMIEMHYVNVTDQPILSESWINFDYGDPVSADSVQDFVAFVGGLHMAVPPYTTQVIQAGGCGIPPWGPDEVRILGLAGHMHAHGRRLTAWKVTADGERTRIYDAYDWEHPQNAYYNSVVQNTPPGTADGVDDAYTGVLTLEKGDSIEYECEIANDLDQTLYFANKAYTADMCNLFGFYTPSMGTPLSCTTF